MQQLLILAADESPRLIYILNELVTRRLGLNYKITTNEDYFLKSNSARINYSNSIIEGCVNIPAHTLLFAENIIKQDIFVITDKIWHSTFFNKAYTQTPDAQTETHWLHFDLFAAAFYLISRYEEYLPNKTDAHGRYKHTNSVAFNSNFLFVPLIDIWVKQAANIILKVYPTLQFTMHTFKHLNTVDIDYVFKYKYLSKFTLLKKQISHFINNRKEALVQLKKFNKQEIPDPYDTFEMLLQYQTENIFFWLLSNNKHTLDKNHLANSAAYLNVLGVIHNKAIHGLHPSYYASANKKALQAEIKNFKQIFGIDPSITRWHFLKINIGKTYPILVENNIKEDWSMGYADTPGFRASTCMPFKYFNLLSNTAADVTIMPITLMDVSLKNGLQLQPFEAIKLVEELKTEVKKVNGLFITIWHNSSFDETEGWKNWPKVYECLFN